MCLIILPACMYVNHVYAWWPQRSGEGVGSPGTGVTGGFKLLCGCWDLNPGPPEEHLVLLTTKSSLQLNSGQF